MGDDKIGLDVGPRLEGVEDGVRLPDGILEGAAAVIRLFGGSALEVVLDARDAVAETRRLLRNEGAAEPMPLRQISANVAELSREIRMDEQNMHDKLRVFLRARPSTSPEPPWCLWGLFYVDADYVRPRNAARIR